MCLLKALSHLVTGAYFVEIGVFKSSFFIIQVVFTAVHITYCALGQGNVFNCPQKRKGPFRSLSFSSSLNNKAAEKFIDT
jgi:hypothetical protein